MLEAGQQRQIGKTLVHRCGDARNTVDFPQSRLRLGEGRGWLGRAGRKRRHTCRQSKSKTASHPANLSRRR
jgi:hypothetical protein